MLGPTPEVDGGCLATKCNVCPSSTSENLAQEKSRNTYHPPMINPNSGPHFRSKLLPSNNLYPLHLHHNPWYFQTTHDFININTSVVSEQGYCMRTITGRHLRPFLCKSTVDSPRVPQQLKPVVPSTQELTPAMQQSSKSQLKKKIEYTRAETERH